MTILIWTFRNSCQNFRRFDYILYSKYSRFVEDSVHDELCLESDHGNILVSIDRQ